MRSTAAILNDPVGSADLLESRPATIEQIDVADPTGDEVHVEITASSLCHTDVAIARGHIDEAYPLVMGHEGAGVVRAVGDAVDSVTSGDQVVLGRITCGRCVHCRAGNGQQCVQREAAKEAGSLRTGTIKFSRNQESLHHCHGVSSFSEHTIVDEEVAIRVPEQLPAEHATLLGCGVFTGVGAVTNTADIELGSSVVVFGAGGVGLSAVQGARIRGATNIIAVDVVPEKLSIAEEVGATATVDASAVTDPVAEVRALCDDGADYAFEVVGDEQVTEQAVATLAPTGQAVLVGVPPAGARDLSLNLYDMVTSEKDIIGSFNGSYSLPLAIPRLAELAIAGTLHLEPLISERKSLDELNRAMHNLEHSTAVRQLIVP